MGVVADIADNIGAAGQFFPAAVQACNVRGALQAGIIGLDAVVSPEYFQRYRYGVQILPLVFAGEVHLL